MSRVLAATGLTFVGADGEEISVQSQKAQAILAYVFLGPSRVVTREKLCGLLWSESPEQMARASLRQCLRRLVKNLSESDSDLLVVERNRVIGGDAVSVDLVEIVGDIGAGKVPESVANPDQILDGFDTLDSEFSMWLHVLRETWRERQTSALSLSISDTTIELKSRGHLAMQLFHIDPTHEPAARTLIEAELHRNNLPGALKVYDRLWQELDDAWGEEPSQDIQNLIVRARQNEETKSNAIQPPTTVPPVIFVGKFQQSGPWHHPSYLIEGFRRELIASLVRFREWIIFDSDVRAAENADYVLTGGFFENKGAAQLTILMTQIRDGHCIVSETVGLDLASWGEMLLRFVHKTALSLNLHLARRRLSGPALDTPDGLNAYDLWLKANEVRSVWRKNTYEEAENLLNQVVEQSPDYAPALSALAGLLSTRHLSEIGVRRSTDRALRARELASRSVALDPLDGRNHHALAWANNMDGAYNKAELHFDLSIELNATNPRTLVPCAQGLSFLGYHEQALSLVKRAIDIHPTMIPRHWGYVQSIYFLSGDFDNSIKVAEFASSSIIDLKAWGAAALAMSGRTDEAEERMEEFVTDAAAAWSGDGMPTRKEIGSWLMHAFPIRRPEDAELLREGCSKAGLPV